MARYDLSETEWRLIEPLLPNKPRGVPRVDDRRVINGIFYVLRTGSPWHDGLQPVQPLGQGGCLGAGVRGPVGRFARVDAPDRQLHHPRPPARRRWKKGGPDHAIGRSRGGLSTKINALVDKDGLPLRIVLSAGQASDKAAVEALIDGLKPARALVADRGYDARAVIDLVEARGGRAHIPTQRDRKVQRSIDPAIYRQRNVVERYFCKLKHFRRIATRFDKLARNFLAAVLLASTRLWLRAYESRT
jgi:transposase